MKKLPFLVFKKGQRRYFYVRFKNGQTGEYLPVISTKKETEAEAIETAFQWLRDGIPRKGETVDFKKYTLRDMAKDADISKADAEFICKELQRRGLLKSHVLEESQKAIDFVTYLTDFWDWEKSIYIKEKLRRNHAIHKRYAAEMTGAINRYWAHFFKGKSLGEINHCQQLKVSNFSLFFNSLIYDYYGTLPYDYSLCGLGTVSKD